MARIKNYYVDEAGDLHLFNRRKQVVVGREGCSTFFILGKADVGSPTQLAESLQNLRAEMLRDPYFKNVPSFDPNRRKTAVQFHAKDDLAEVRREVFRIIAASDVRLYAVVRDKRVIARRVREENVLRPSYRYHPNQLYDRAVSQLFKERLHKDDAYEIIFARRGRRDRTRALERALQAARDRFKERRGIDGSGPIAITASDPTREPCLQVADYFLWALQRTYERGEDRFLTAIADKIGLVWDVDDTRDKPTGEYYTAARPATTESVQRA